MTYYVQTYDVGDEPGQDGEWVTVALGYSNVSIYVSQE